VGVDGPVAAFAGGGGAAASLALAGKWSGGLLAAPLAAALLAPFLRTSNVALAPAAVEAGAAEA